VLDDRLREFERRSRATGSPEDHARFLVERARHRAISAEGLLLAGRLLGGELSLESLELAAYAGHPPALEVVGDEIIELASFLGDVEAVRVVLRDEDLTWSELSAWVRVLGRWGRIPLVVVMIAGAEFAIGRILVAAEEPGYELEHYNSLLERARLKIERARGWVQCPCESHREAMIATASRYMGWEESSYPELACAAETLEVAVRGHSSHEPYELLNHFPARRWLETLEGTRERATVLAELCRSWLLSYAIGKPAERGR
jgi:hypothetical protein